MKLRFGFSCIAAMALITSAGSADTGQLADREAQIAERAADILSRMTLEEKIGQIIQADIGSVTPEDVRRYNLGSILNGGNSAPGGGKTASPNEWLALADAFWNASTDTSDGGVGIPVLWGTDAVHGHNNLQSATIFPHNIGLGAAMDADLIYRIARVTAREVRATGIDWTFAPTLAVAQDDRWGRAYESYSEDPRIVALYSRAMVEGLQGRPGDSDFLAGGNVIATAKHFIGDGGTENGVDKGDTTGDLVDIISLHGAGYPPAIDVGVQTVMASFSSVNGVRMHGYPQLLNNLLRGGFGFSGFVVGDWNGHADIPGCTPTDCPEALAAGIDMYMAPDSWRGLYRSLLAQARSGEIDSARLDEAVLRILTVKVRAGLFDAGAPSQRSGSNLSLLGSAEHRAVAREAVRESLVLLQNNNSVLPLQPGQRVLIAGSGADSIQQQTGGWTLSWQGDNNRNEDFEAADSIYAGLQQALADIGGTAILSADGSYEERPDVAVVVFGEQPYAEFRGDRSDLIYERSNGRNLRLLRSFQEAGIPVVSIFLSGRPMWVNPHLNASDAFVAAWLPGTEGGGVADVIVADASGAPRHDFQGRLSFSWPATGDGTPINGANAEGALFRLGYGLTYTDSVEVGNLSEQDSTTTERGFVGTILARGDAAGGLNLHLGSAVVTSLAAQSPDGALTMSGVDYEAQEDSRLLRWSANNSLAIRSAAALDLSNMESTALSIVWRVDALADGDAQVGMGCGESCAGLVSIATIVGDTMAEWRTDTIALRCLVAAGLDLTNVDAPLVISAGNTTQIALHSAELVEQQAGSGRCPE